MTRSGVRPSSAPFSLSLAESVTYGHPAGWAWSSARDYTKLRTLAAAHGWRHIGGVEARSSVPIDSVRVDRYDFPEDALGSIWVDGKACAELVGPARETEA